jgi:hypothetical protein
VLSCQSNHPSTADFPLDIQSKDHPTASSDPQLIHSNRTGYDLHRERSPRNAGGIALCLVGNRLEEGLEETDPPSLKMREAAGEKFSQIPHRHQRLRSRLMVLEGLNWFALKKCIILESFESTKVLIFLAPIAFK